MKLYVAELTIDREFGRILGVFTTEEAARTHIKLLVNNYAIGVIHTMWLDYPYAGDGEQVI